MLVKQTRRGRPRKNKVLVTAQNPVGKPKKVKNAEDHIVELKAQVESLQEALSIVQSQANNLRTEMQQQFLSSVFKETERIKFHCSQVEEKTNGLNYNDVSYSLGLFYRLLEQEYQSK